MVGQIRIQGLARTEGVAGGHGFANLGGQKRDFLARGALVPRGRLHLIAAEPHQAVSAPHELLELFGLPLRDFGNIREHQHIDLAEILGGKRQPRHGARAVVLSLDATRPRHQRSDHQPPGIAGGAIDAKHRDLVPHHGHRAPHVVRVQRIAGDFRGDAGRTGIVEGNEE